VEDSRLSALREDAVTFGKRNLATEPATFGKRSPPAVQPAHAPATPDTPVATPERPPDAMPQRKILADEIWQGEHGDSCASSG